MNQEKTYNRFEFLKYIAAVAAATAIPACGKHGSDSAPTPSLASKFTPQYVTINSNLYGNGSTPAIASGTRHNTMLTFIPKEDITAAIGYILKDPSGKTEWSWYSQPMAFAKDTQITTPIKSIPVKSSNGGLYDLDCRVRAGSEDASILRVSPQASMGPAIASTYTVKEALDWLISQYSGNANPGIVSVVGDTAPASDVIGAADINGGILADVASKYGISGTLASKLVSELATIDAASGFQLGQKASNAYVNTLLGSIVTPAGFLKPFDFRNGNLALAVTGATDMDVRRAARAVAQHASYNMNYNQVEVDGTTLSDITTKQG